MEKFSRQQTNELRLWYVEAMIYPSRRYRGDLGANPHILIQPVRRRFQIWHDNWSGNNCTEELKRFFDSCDEKGHFQIRGLAENTGFSRVHLDGVIHCNPSRPLTLAEAIYGETLKEDDRMGEDNFKRYFRKGEGEITAVAYAPTGSLGVSLWYYNLYTIVANFARIFSFHDFVHILGKSSPIQEEQIRRYALPAHRGST